METNFEQLDAVVKEFEQTLSFRYGGNLAERTNHVLSQYRQIATNSIFEAKRFLEDAKTQFKALEIVIEGLTSEGLNHSHKRIIANHVIGMLRSMVDKLDGVEYEFTTGMVERYSFFRSNTPERKLYEERSRLAAKEKEYDCLIKQLEQKHPEILNDLRGNLPF